MTHALLIHAHPTPDTFGTSMARAWSDGAEEAGLPVRHLVLRDLAFDPILRQVDQLLEDDLVAARDAIKAASHLVFQFPVWWGNQPALLRGFVDRTFTSGWAFRNTGAAMPDGLLAGRSARILATMDSPWFWYRLAHGRPAHNALRQATLRYCGITDVAETTGYGLRHADEAARAALIERVHRDGRTDARRLLARRPALQLAAD